MFEVSSSANVHKGSVVFQQIEPSACRSLDKDKPLNSNLGKGDYLKSSVVKTTEPKLPV